MTDSPCPITSAQRCKMLLDALAGYRAAVPACYDEPLQEVIDRVKRSGSLGKADLGALYLWKRIPRGKWASQLLSMPDERVRAATATMVTAARNKALLVPQAAGSARSGLVSLPGMQHGDAFASTAILAAAPDRMAVYDRRAHRGLGKVCLDLSDEPGRYARYMDLVEQCRAELRQHGGGNRAAREVDLALYWLDRA